MVCVSTWRIVAFASGLLALNWPIAIVERQPAFFDASHDERRRERLGQPVEVHGRVGAHGDGVLDVLIPEPALPENAVAADDGSLQPGDTELLPQAFEVLAKAAVDQIFRARISDDQQDRDNAVRAARMNFRWCRTDTR